MTTAIGLPKVEDASSLELENWGPLEEATGPEMTTAGFTLWKHEGADDEAGVWQCTPGPSRWELATNEFVHIVAGRMTVTEDGAAPIEVGAGDTVLFANGWKGTWDIHETVRKLYVIF
jgi:uncharacterized cupin superfamily protein